MFFGAAACSSWSPKVVVVAVVIAKMAVPVVDDNTVALNDLVVLLQLVLEMDLQ